jgi:hypothetical protein
MDAVTPQEDRWQDIDIEELKQLLPEHCEDCKRAISCFECHSIKNYKK